MMNRRRRNIDRANMRRKKKAIRERLVRVARDRVRPVLEEANIKYEVADRSRAISTGGLPALHGLGKGGGAAAGGTSMPAAAMGSGGAESGRTVMVGTASAPVGSAGGSGEAGGALKVAADPAAPAMGGATTCAQAALTPATNTKADIPTRLTMPCFINLNPSGRGARLFDNKRAQAQTKTPAREAGYSAACQDQNEVEEKEAHGAKTAAARQCQSAERICQTNAKT